MLLIVFNRKAYFLNKIFLKISLFHNIKSNLMMNKRLLFKNVQKVLRVKLLIINFLIKRNKKSNDDTILLDHF